MNEYTVLCDDGETVVIAAPSEYLAMKCAAELGYKPVEVEYDD